MELDDLKADWQRMQRELATQQRIPAKLLAEQTNARIQNSLKPLFSWQVFQVIVGIALAGFSAQFWLPRVDQTLLLVSGIVIHIYAIALIINGIHVMLRLKEIDYSAPVTTLQKRVGRLERSYVLSGWILGLPWWLLWIPVALMLLTLVGIDVSGVPAANWLPANIIIGIIGMVLTVVGFHWARRSSRPGVRANVERMVSGASIDKAKHLMADIERFEQDAD